MQISRGDLSPDVVGSTRRRELEEIKAAQEPRRGGAAGESAAASPESAELHSSMLLAQRHVARAQSVLAGLEGFRDFLLLAGASPAAGDALGALRRATYQGEAVLEPHREALLGIAARRDHAGLERLIANVQETIASQAAEFYRGGSAEPQPDTVRGVVAGIRELGESLQNLNQAHVLKLLG